MRKTDDHTLPPPSALEALRQPRRRQLGDLNVRRLLSEWKRRGRSIEYGDLNRVADLLGVAQPDAKTRRKIVAAVEAAGIRIRNHDAWNRMIAKTGRKGLSERQRRAGAGRGVAVALA